MCLYTLVSDSLTVKTMKVMGFLLLALTIQVSIGHNESDPCFPIASNRCITNENNLIATFTNVQNVFGCAEYCREYPECEWWIFDSFTSTNKKNKCELIKGFCERIYSQRSQLGERCGVLFPHQNVAIVFGGKNKSDLIPTIEIFDEFGPCAPSNDPIVNNLSDSHLRYSHVSEYIPYKNLILSCGGKDTNGLPLKTCIYYNQMDYEWKVNESVVPSLIEVCYEASASYALGEVYVLGGVNQNSQIMNIVQIYDPVHKRWRFGPSMISDLSQHCSLRVKDSIYVFGGLTSNRTFNTLVSKYNISQESWSILSSMKWNRRSHACLYLESSEKILLFGGFEDINDSFVVNDVLTFDVKTSKWIPSNIEPMKTSRSRHGLLLFSNDVFVVVGGYGSLDNVLQTVEMYETTWVSATYQLSFARDSFSLLSLDKTMLVTDCHNS